MCCLSTRVEDTCSSPSRMSTFEFTPKGIHTKCRHPNEYLVKSSNGDDEKHPRTPVADALVPWEVPMKDYCPTAFTAAFVLSAAWADPQLGADGFDPRWNSVDGKINRKSHEGDYGISKDNEPLNIRGRTGLKERGVLGKWGPNHAADPGSVSTHYQPVFLCLRAFFSTSVTLLDIRWSFRLSNFKIYYTPTT